MTLAEIETRGWLMAMTDINVWYIEDNKDSKDKDNDGKDKDDKDNDNSVSKKQRERAKVSNQERKSDQIHSTSMQWDRRQVYASGAVESIQQQRQGQQQDDDAPVTGRRPWRYELSVLTACENCDGVQQGSWDAE
jgi:hypothetical protein